MSSKKVGVFWNCLNSYCCRQCNGLARPSGLSDFRHFGALGGESRRIEEHGNGKGNESTRGYDSGRDRRRRNWWHARPPGRCWSFGDPWPGPVHRRRSHHGRPSGIGRWRGRWWSYRRLDWHGYSRIRSQEIRRSPAEGRNSALSALRHCRGNQTCEGSSQVGGGRGCFLHARIFR